MIENCEKCEYFLQTHTIPNGEGAEPAGICRRYPPVPVQVKPGTDEGSGFQFQTLWPSTLGGWGCGEFSVKEELKQ